MKTCTRARKLLRTLCLRRELLSSGATCGRECEYYVYLGFIFVFFLSSSSTYYMPPKSASNSCHGKSCLLHSCIATCEKSACFFFFFFPRIFSSYDDEYVNSKSLVAVATGRRLRTRDKLTCVVAGSRRPSTDGDSTWERVCTCAPGDTRD
jgi:hypothetical protein